MFLEQSTNRNRTSGSIEVICGSMFSGKTEELIRRLKRARIAKQRVEIFKPLVDQRYHATDVVSHDANSIASTPVDCAGNMLLMVGDIEVVGIDEAQFFDSLLPEVCQKLAAAGVRVIVAGLDMDYLGNPFGPMPQLMAVADHVTKVHAICMNCGSLAQHSFRKANNDAQILLGEQESYAALCRSCFHEQVSK